jgi:hypothetical protein
LREKIRQGGGQEVTQGDGNDLTGRVATGLHEVRGPRELKRTLQ